MVLLMKHIWKIKGWFCQKGEKCDEIATGHFSKITETARCEPPWKAVYSELSIAIHLTSKAGYVTTGLAIDQSGAWEAISFCDFWKITSCDFTLFYSFLNEANIHFFRCAW